MLLRLRETLIQPLRLQEIPPPLRHPRSKRYTLSITWEMSRECSLQWPPVTMALKLTISYLEMTLYSTESFPDFLSITPNLMTNNCEKLSNIQTVSGQKYQHLFQFWFLIPSWSCFGSGLILPKLSGSGIEMKAKQKCSSSNLFKLNLVLATLQLTQLVALQRDWYSYKLESNLLQTLF